MNKWGHSAFFRGLSQGLSPKGTVPIRRPKKQNVPISKQKGYVLFTVVVMLVVVAVMTFLVSYDSSLKASMPAGEAEASRVDYVTEAAMQHALWRAGNNACMGDVTIPVTTLGPDTYKAAITGAAAGTLYTLSADQDAWIRSDNVTQNNGNSDQKISFNSGTIEQALFRFDLMPLPADARINSATAWFHIKTTNAHPEGPIKAYRVTADWTEFGATWETIGDKVESLELATIPAQSTGGVWVQINLTAQVQAWANGQANYGISLGSTAEGLNAVYVSREDPSNPPRLEVVVGSGPDAPLTVQATGTLSNGVTRVSTRLNANAYQPASTYVSEPGPGIVDTFAFAFKVNNNYGSNATIEVGDEGSERLTLIQPNPAAVPPGSKVVSAELALNLESVFSAAAGSTVSAYAMLEPWTEDGATYETSDGSTSWQWPGAYDAANPAGVVPFEAAVPGWHSWDITQLVQGWASNSSPNNGLVLVGKGINNARFTSSDAADTALHPKITIKYACECGSACMAPQGSGVILLVVPAGGNLSPYELMLRSMFESWGFSVKTIGAGAVKKSFDDRFLLDDVVFVAGTNSDVDIGSKLTDAPIGVVSELGALNDELGIASSSAAPVGATINISDSSHYITLPFASGPLDIYSAAMQGLAVAGTPAPGLQTLADWSGAGGPVVLDVGGELSFGGTAAGRRVLLPHDGSKIDFAHINGNGRLIMQRALQWGTGNTGGAPALIYRDEFSNLNCNAADYTGSDGTLDWSPWAWAEGFDDGSSCTGSVILTEDDVVPDPNNYRLRISGNTRSVERTADLSAFTTAWLSFDYRREALMNGDYVRVEVWDNAGAAWVELDEFAGPATDADYQTTSYDISAYISPNFAVRYDTFGLGPNNYIYLDNIQISETAPAPAPPPISLRVLMIVGDLTLSDKDVGYKALIESWGYAVSLIDDGDSQANYDMAMDAADVILASGSASGASMLDKATNTTKGMVNEVSGKIDNFGFSSSTSATHNFGTFQVTSPTHYITEPFNGGPVLVFDTALTNPVPSGTFAPDLQNVGEVGGSGVIALATLDTGATRYDSNPSPGRRVHLPFTVATTSNLTTDGKIILHRAIEWAAAPPPATCDADYAPDTKLGEFSTSAYGSNNIQGITYLPEGRSFKEEPVPAGGAWISINYSDGELYMTDLSGVHLTNLKSPSGAPTGVTYVASGTWADHLALIDQSVGEVQYMDLKGKLVSSFSTLAYPSVVPTDVAFIGATASGTYDDHLAVVDSNVDMVYLVTQSGSVVSSFDTSAFSTKSNGIVHLPGSDKFLLVDWSAIAYIVDFDGNVLRQYDSDPFGTTAPEAITINPLTCDHVVGDDTPDLVVTLNQSGGGGGGGQYYLDQFNAIAYNGDDGTLSWTGDWLESGESDGPGAGIIMVVGDRLRVWGKNGGESLAREADLSSTTTATLTFNYQRDVVENAGSVTLQVSDNGGGSWTSLQTYLLTADDPAPVDESYDITAYIASDTQIRFLANGGEDGQFIYFDNVQIGIDGGGGGGGGGGGACNGTYLDQFEVYQFDNSDGTLDWSASPWQEVGESDGPTAGDIRIWSDLNSVRIRTRDNDNGGEGIEREADLSGAAAATLSYDYRRDRLDDSSDYTTVEVSANGATGPWTELARYAGPDNDSAYTTASHDIGAYIGANTRIRFKTSSSMGGLDEVWFDNVEIACTP